MFTEAGAADPSATPGLLDALGRSLRDLRISVTDRCNFRCSYCMPREVFGPDHVFLSRRDILSFEEIARLAQVFIRLGTRKIRLTGGEPLLRRELPTLVSLLAHLPGLADLTMTTNGSALVSMAKPLRDAGLHRLTVSLDALDDAVFRSMNDVDFPVERVLAGLDAAARAGFGPIKINMVVKRGVNDHQVLPMARRFRDPKFILRFIEFMDVGNANGWRMDEVVPAKEILQMIAAEFPLEPISDDLAPGVARRWRYQDGAGEIGVITSVTQPFCQGCTRARLSADGHLYTCLFASQGHDLRSLVRRTADDAELEQAVRRIWAARTDRYSELRSSRIQGSNKVEMSHIGG